MPHHEVDREQRDHEQRGREPGLVTLGEADAEDRAARRTSRARSCCRPSSRRPPAGRRTPRRGAASTAGRAAGRPRLRRRRGMPAIGRSASRNSGSASASDDEVDVPHPAGYVERRQRSRRARQRSLNLVDKPEPHSDADEPAQDPERRRARRSALRCQGRSRHRTGSPQSAGRPRRLRPSPESCSLRLSRFDVIRPFRCSFLAAFLMFSRSGTRQPPARSRVWSVRDAWQRECSAPERRSGPASSATGGGSSGHEG